MIVFVRSYIADFDARLGKYFRALEAAGLPFGFIGWNKDGRQCSDAAPHFFYYQRRARLGGGWGNLFALCGWNFFVLRRLIAMRAEVRIVHAVDLDTVLAAWLFCAVFRRKLVFDLYDKYTAVRGIGGLVGRFVDTIEHSIARQAALTLIVSEERRIQHRLGPELSNVVVLENVPQAGLDSPTSPAARKPWKIGYFGVLEPHHRGLEDLLEACRGRADVELHIAGYGGLTERFAAEAHGAGNVHFHGPMTSAAGLALMAGMDVLVGFYYLSVPNHAYASPNKYYEHLMLGRPLATTRGTPPGARVVADGTGWALEEGYEAIVDWLDRLNPDQILGRAGRARKLWERKYASYIEQYYHGVYVSRIRELTRTGTPNATG